MKTSFLFALLILYSLTAFGFWGFKKAPAESESLDDIIFVESDVKGMVLPVVKRYLVPIYSTIDQTLVLQYGGAEKPINTFKNISLKKAYQILNQLYPQKKKFFCLNESGLFDCSPEILLGDEEE